VLADDTALGLVVELTEAKLLELIESAYPNPVTVDELATQHGWDADALNKTLTTLQEKGLVQALEHGAFTRAGQADINVQVCFLPLNGTVVSLRPFALIKCSIFLSKNGMRIFQIDESMDK
jgi:predicted transcriptional regulator